MVGLSLSSDGLREFVSSGGMHFPVYTLDPSVAQSIPRLQMTPQTLVIAPDGTVLREILGVYSGSNKSALETYFSLSLSADQG